MCGRFTYRYTWKEIHDLLEGFGAALAKVGEGVEEHPFRNNIAPTQPIIVVRTDPDTKQRRADLMRWGLVPTWVKDPREFSLIINARVETILQKPSFRGGLRHHRAIVPASGYYEWQKLPDGRKQPQYITRADGEPMWLAAIYADWLGPSGEEISTTAIITVPANPEMEHLHPRTPALIPNEFVRDWLDIANVGEKAAHAILRSAPFGQFEHHPVSTRVNSARNEGEDLIAEVTNEDDQKAATAEGDEAKKPKKRKNSGQLDLF